MIDLSNKIALITGSGTGIGLVIALTFAKHGADVVVNDVNDENGRNAADKIKDMGRNSFYVRADVSKNDEVEEMVKRIIIDFGRIDILVNNAGVSSTALLVDLKESDWDWILNVNTKGVFLCSKFVAREMIRQKSGKIVNIGSRAARVGLSMYTHYSASKFGVIGLTQSIAQELAPHGINVNAVCPGKVDTAMIRREWVWESEVTGASPEEIEREIVSSIPLGRMAQPEDIAKVAVFLASDYAAYMTGQALNVTGGLRMD